MISQQQRGSWAYFRAHASQATLYGPRPRELTVAGALAVFIVKFRVESKDRFKLSQIVVVNVWILVGKNKETFKLSKL